MPAKSSSIMTIEWNLILEYFHYSEYMTFYSIWKINYCIFNAKKILKIGLENKKFCTNYCIGFFDIYVEWNLQQTLGYATSEISAAIVTHCKRTSFKGMHPYNSILHSRFYSGRVIFLHLFSVCRERNIFYNFGIWNICDYVGACFWMNCVCSESLL